MNVSSEAIAGASVIGLFVSNVLNAALVFMATRWKTRQEMGEKKLELQETVYKNLTEAQATRIRDLVNEVETVWGQVNTLHTERTKFQEQLDRCVREREALANRVSVLEARSPHLDSDFDRS